MGEPYEPREHDHLVEPMFHALREEVPRAEEPRPARRGRFLLLGLPIVALAIWGLLRLVA